MFPLYDRPKVSGRKPWVTVGLIVINIFIFLISLPHLEEIIFVYGLSPSKITSGQSLFTLFTSMFFHAGFGHIIGNMWFLWVFGDNMERKMGGARFLIFYLLVGVLSGIIYVLFSPLQSVPAIGASGAISGILGGYLVLFPKHKIVSLVPIFFFIQIIAIPAIVFIGVWFLYQILYIGQATAIAYSAHIAGFVVGIILVKFFVGKDNTTSYILERFPEGG